MHDSIEKRLFGTPTLVAIRTNRAWVANAGGQCHAAAPEHERGRFLERV
jgi:hypothetical protein